MNDTWEQQCADARQRIRDLFVPETPEEQKTAEWLEQWGPTTMDRISAMVQRRIARAVRADDEAHHFAGVWGHIVTAVHLARQLTCVEVEALAALLIRCGKAEAAQAWRAEHAVGDESTDLHNPDGTLRAGDIEEFIPADDEPAGATS
jgi:hypothetical protein